MERDAARTSVVQTGAFSNHSPTVMRETGDAGKPPLPGVTKFYG